MRDLAPPAARGSREAGFTQPRVPSFTHPCTNHSSEISLGPSRSVPEMRLFSSNEWDLFDLVQNGVDSRGVNAGELSVCLSLLLECPTSLALALALAIRRNAHHYVPLRGPIGHPPLGFVRTSFLSLTYSDCGAVIYQNCRQFESDRARWRVSFSLSFAFFLSLFSPLFRSFSFIHSGFSLVFRRGRESLSLREGESISRYSNLIPSC